MAVQAARTLPGQIATLILPSDTCWDQGGIPAQALPTPIAQAAPPNYVAQVARGLWASERVQA
jgi:acetolactate synthase-1/2/3 large subunit